MDSKESDVASVPGCLARMFWMGGGFVVLLFISVFIWESRSYSYRDGLFWLIVALLVLVRYIDVRLLRGQTADCTPATMVHWRRYTLRFVPIALGVWVLIHVLR